MKYLRTILLFIFAIPVIAFSQERGIKIVAIDEATKEWQEISLYNKTHAVIIGIDQYPQLSTEQQLTYAVSDAKAVECMLKGKFVFNEIYALYNEQATKSNIEDVLLNKLSKISKNDAVFVFFAGHGGQEKTDYGAIGYIVPYDGNFKDMRKVISMSTIRDDISKRINAKHVFFVMDACYSGLLLTTRGTESTLTKRDYSYLKQIAKESVRQVLTAGDANQQVLDGGPNGHSVFTGRFLEILDSAEDFITAEEISAKVKEMVFSDANARGHIQTPKSGTLFGMGDFIFMPSLTKKQGSIKQQVSDLENELKRIEELEILAREQENEAEKRGLERQRKIAESQLQAKKLEEQRLEKERIQKESQEQERKQKLAELKQKQEEETQRLSLLKQQVEEKREQLAGTTLASLAPEKTISEMREIDAKIKEIKESFRKELILGVKAVTNRINNEFLNIRNKRKDEFETKEEFSIKIKKEIKIAENEQSKEIIEVGKRIEEAYNQSIEPFIQNIKKLSGNEFTITSDNLILELHDYDAISDTYPVTISPKQTINGKIVTINANIPIPRQEARLFKQYFENNMLRPEIKCNFQSLDFFRVNQAHIIDDATNKQYNIFTSEFVDLGNGIVIDTKSNLLWSKNAQIAGFKSSKSGFSNETFDGDLNMSLSKIEISGLKGWQVPNHNEIKNMFSLKNRKHPFINIGGVEISRSGCSDFGFLAKKDSYRSGGTIDGYVVYSINTGQSNRLCGHRSQGPVIWPVHRESSIIQENIIDEGTLKQYNLYESEFFDLGDGTVLDIRTTLIWSKNAQIIKFESTKKRYKDTFYEDLENQTSRIDISGLKGWRVPIYFELNKMSSLKKKQHPFINTDGVRISNSGCSDSGFLAKKDNYRSGGTIDGYLVYSIDSGSSNRLCGFSKPNIVIWPVRGVSINWK